MKKLLSIVLALTILSSCLALVGCNVFGELFDTTGTMTPTVTTTTQPAPPPPEPVDDELKWKVIDDYLIWSGILDDKKPEEIDCEFFGRYGDSAAVYFHTAGSYGELLQRYDTAGYRFIYPDSRVIRIWNDGNFYTITEAYEMGLIVEDDVASINYLFQDFEFKEPYFIYQEKSIDYIYLIQDFNEDSVFVNLDSGICREGKEFDVRFFRGVEIDYIKLVLSQNTTQGYTPAYRLDLKHPSKENVLEACKTLMNIDGVVRARPTNWNGWGGIICDSEESSNVISQYALEADEIPVLSIQDQQIWNFTVGSDAVKVGVIDTGIASHEDLDDNYYLALDFYEHGNDLSASQSADTRSHGTHVAGIIGAVGNNGMGISGVNQDVSLVQMRVGGNDVAIQYVDDAINWAAQNWNTNNQIRILNGSFRFDDDVDDVDVVEDIRNAIINYTNAGGLFICSAGNDNKNIDIFDHHVYPAYYTNPNSGYDIENMIVVGALNSSGTDRWIEDYNTHVHPQGSNWGANTVDIYAIGENVLSTIPPELCNITGCALDYHYKYGYHRYAGTSMATPMVAGTAALLLSVDPGLTAAEIKACILGGADTITITVGDGETQEVKKLNVWGAFTYLMDNYYPMPTATLSSNTITCTGTISSDGDYLVDNTYLQKVIASSSGYFDFIINSSYPIEVVLYDENFSEKSINYYTSEDGNTVSFIYEAQEGEIFYIKSTFTGSVLMYTDITIGISQHSHEYGSWRYTDSISHTKICTECGHHMMGEHVIRVSEIIVDRAPCIYCGRFIKIDENFSNIIHNIQKVSVNGSYILPNGIIVLVDEDVEAYMNGTLVFYDKDKVPELQ